MEIIKRGVPPTEKAWTGTCYTCKSVIKAVRTEIKVTYDQRDGESAFARCPVCGTSMSFNED